MSLGGSAWISEAPGRAFLSGWTPGLSNALKATGDYEYQHGYYHHGRWRDQWVLMGNLQLNEGPPALADSGRRMGLSVDHAPEPLSCRPSRRPEMSAPLRAMIKEQPSATLPFRERKMIHRVLLVHQFAEGKRDVVDWRVTRFALAQRAAESDADKRNARR